MDKRGKIKRPWKNKVVKVPVIMQLEALECGAASLAMILAYYGRWIPLEQVRFDCGVSRDGSNARNILRAARSYGLRAKGFRYETELLRKNGSFPCIVHWNFNHFVVLDGFKGEKAYLNDPERGAYAVSIQTFDDCYTGICLMFEPAADFTPSGKPMSVIRYCTRRLKDAKTALAFAVLTTLISSLIGIINPAFSRIFLDRLLTHEAPQWLTPFFGSLMVLTAVQLIVAWIQCVYALKIRGKMEVVGSAAFMWKILHLPMEFFSQRMAGDIQGRKASNASIADTIVNTFAPLVFHGAMMIFYLVVMIRYSVVLTVIGLTSVAVNLLISRIISKKRINVTRCQQRDAGKLSGATVAGIEIIETIKASGAENGFFEKWSGYQASANAQEVRYERLNALLGMAPGVINGITGTAILTVGVYYAMEGSFTIGMIMAFQGFLNAFLSPASSLIRSSQTIEQMGTEIERVEDVMKYPSDRAVQAESTAGLYDKLSGKVELKNVTFGYSRLAEPLIRDFSMTLMPGSRVAFVGTSGCGKSTLAKLISGLYQPWSGQILFDGKPISEIDHCIFTGSLAVVDQDIILFEDTIANNIKMWDSSIEDFEMILAARDAQLHEDIMQRDGGYQYKITEGGKDFSGGQRQRMEIARVLAQDPTIIIMDEATSALDAKTEYDVVRSIKERGITCMVVAHRLSTIRDCDEIIVMDQGKVIERGKHEALMSQNGYYAQLVANE